MLPDISEQLVAERQRALLEQAAHHRLARQARAADRDGHDSWVRTSLAPWALRIRTAGAVRIRPIRPSDRELLLDGFSRLSAESRRRRFFVSKNRLSSKELSYFTEVDHHDHEALVAVSRLGGKGLAVARYVRLANDPDAADVAVTVVDEWQGRGLGTALVARLAARARCEGIHRFTAMVLRENAGARRLLPKVGAVTLVGADREALEYEVALPPVAAERRAYRRSLLAPANGCAGCA